MSKTETVQALIVARNRLRAAIQEAARSPCDITELTVASMGATVCALEARARDEDRAFCRCGKGGEDGSES